MVMEFYHGNSYNSHVNRTKPTYFDHSSRINFTEQERNRRVVLVFEVVIGSKVKVRKLIQIKKKEEFIARCLLVHLREKWELEVKQRREKRR